MIKVTVIQLDQQIKGITIQGHSNSAPKGKDIVCAGVSAVGVGAVNAIYEITKVEPNVIMDDGFLEVKFLSSKECQLIAKVMLIQLKSIEESYSDYLKIHYITQEVL